MAAEHDDGAVVLVVILVAAEAREAPALPPHDDNAATLALVIKGDAALFFAFVVSAHYLFPRRTVWSSDAIYPEHENENDPNLSNNNLTVIKSLLIGTYYIVRYGFIKVCSNVSSYWRAKIPLVTRASRREEDRESSYKYQK